MYRKFCGKQISRSCFCSSIYFPVHFVFLFPFSSFLNKELGYYILLVCNILKVIALRKCHVKCFGYNNAYYFRKSIPAKKIHCSISMYTHSIN